MIKGSTLMNVVFGISTAIVIFLVVILGIKAFYPVPSYDKINGLIKPQEVSIKPVSCTPEMTISACDNLQAQENLKNTIANQALQKQIDQAQKDYQDAVRARNTIVFYIANVIGIIAVLVSMFIVAMPNIGAGTALAGVALIVYGFVNGWSYASDPIKFSIGLIVAILIISFGVIMNKKAQKN